MIQGTNKPFADILSETNLGFYLAAKVAPAKVERERKNVNNG